jgi:predicted transcriptional regulator
MGAQQLGSRWGTVAASVMRRPGLSVAAKAVYAALATYADRVGWIWVRQETIASDLERSRAWVHAAIAELEEQGLLLHDRQYIEGRQRASRYRLQDGVARRRSDAESEAAEVSEQADAAVQPADTSHHDESNTSFSSSAREPVDPVSAEPVSADWVPTVDDIAWAKSRHPNLDVLAFTESFVLSCRAKGYRYADPSAAWRRWLIEPKGKLPQLPAATSSSAANAAPAQEPAHETRSAKPRNRGPAHPSVPAGGSLSDDNRRRAAACLDRLMGRRAGDPSAGHAG